MSMKLVESQNLGNRTARRMIVAAYEAHGGHCISCTEDVLRKLDTFWSEVPWRELFEDYRRFSDLEENAEKRTDEIERIWIGE